VNDWLTPGLRAQLDRYTTEARRHDPTDGFMLHCARLHPDFDAVTFASKSTDAGKKYLKTLLGIPPARNVTEGTKEDTR